MSMTDSCFIEGTSSKNTTCRTWHLLPRHPAAVAAVSVSVPTYSSVPMPSPRTGTDEYVGLVVCVVSDNKMGYAFSRYVWLAGGHMLAVSVCLMQLAKLRQRSEKAVQPTEPRP